jgi:hypothetical protein
MPPRQGAAPPQRPGQGAEEPGPPKTFQYRDFSTGLVRAGARPGIPDEALWDCLNAQIIGPGEILTLPGPGDSIVTLSPDAVSLWGIVINLSGTESPRLVAVCSDGSILAINPTTGATTTICAATVMASTTRLAMWRDTHVLFADPTKGVASWDGTTFVKYPATFTATLTSGTTTITWTAGTAASALIAGMGLKGTGIAAGTTILSVVGTTITISANATASGSQTITVGTGAPTSARDIEVFEGRVWLVTGTRGLTFSGPGSFTTFETIYSGGAAILTDSVFQGEITAIQASIGILWVLGADAINTISNVQIDATTGATTFQNDNLVAGAGTPFADSIQPLFRTLIFLSHPGVYAILGATPQKLSDALDGLFQSGPVDAVGSGPAGVFHLSNIMVYAVLVTVGGDRRLLVYSRPTWALAKQNDNLLWVTTLVAADGELQLWGTDGPTVFQCFAGTTGDYEVAFKQFDYEAVTRKKTVMRWMVEVGLVGATQAQMDVFLENENTSQQQTVTALSSNITWINNTGGAITWQNNSLGPITWAANGRVVMFGEAGFSGNLVSMRLRGTDSGPIIIGAFAWAIGASGEWVF